MMKNIYDQIYWDAEALKSYTDLTGNRFDIERAQLLLWKMNPILKNHPNHPAKQLYDKMDELLERAHCFDKILFSEHVDALYSQAEKEKRK